MHRDRYIIGAISITLIIAAVRIVPLLLDPRLSRTGGDLWSQLLTQTVLLSMGAFLAYVGTQLDKSEPWQVRVGAMVLGVVVIVGTLIFFPIDLGYYFNHYLLPST